MKTVKVEVIDESIHLLLDIHQQFKLLIKKVYEEEALKCIRMHVYRISDLFYFRHQNLNSDLYTASFSTHIDKGLKLLEQTYGVRYYGNIVKTMSEVLSSLHDARFHQNTHEQSIYREILDNLEIYNYKIIIMAKCLVQYLLDSFGYRCGIKKKFMLAYVSSPCLVIEAGNTDL